MKLRLLTFVAFTALALTGFAATFDCGSLRFYNDYKVDPYVRAAMSLQGMGRDAACQALLSRTNENERGMPVIVLCRMLFTQRGTSEMRNPKSYGFVPLLLNTQPSDETPPVVAIVDGIPFKCVLNGFDHGGGLDESADSYLRYCMDNCDWNTVKFHAPTTKEKSDALARLLSSSGWKRSLTNWSATLSNQIH
jgi:hypothetical protein